MFVADTGEMQASFLFETDARRRLIRVRMGGFFEAADVILFVVALEQALARLGKSVDRHLTIVDMREMSVQAQERVEAFRKILDHPAYRSSRLAIVASPSLARSQVKRAAEGRQAEYFNTPDEAEAWLFGNERPAAKRGYLSIKTGRDIGLIGLAGPRRAQMKAG